MLGNFGTTKLGEAIFPACLIGAGSEKPREPEIPDFPTQLGARNCQRRSPTALPQPCGTGLDKCQAKIKPLRNCLHLPPIWF